MKLAILLLCHKNAKQINMFLDAMQHRDIDFYIHTDRKSNIAGEILQRENVWVLPESDCVFVEWGGLSQVDATLKLLEAAMPKHYDYYWLCSGQDFPIKPVDQIIEQLKCHLGWDYINLFDNLNWGLCQSNKYDKRVDIFYPEWIMGRVTWKRILKRAYVEITGGYNRTWMMHRKNSIGCTFYFGSQWWCLRHVVLDWMMDYFLSHPEYYNFYRNAPVPDESFFHTVYMNSPYRECRRDYLHYIDWSEGASSPKVLGMNDIERLTQSDKLIARKFDMETAPDVIEWIQSKLIQSNPVSRYNRKE